MLRSFLIPYIRRFSFKILIPEKLNGLSILRNYIKVGIYDSPLFWAHEDFGDGTIDGTKVKGGIYYLYDLNAGWQINIFPDFYYYQINNSSHGTSCAGIIGSITNNNKGIAGIAGGNYNENNTGVSLYTFSVFPNYTYGLPLDKMKDMIVRGACNYNSDYCYGLDIMNMSFGGQYDYNEMREAIDICFENKCIVVCSRGNTGDNSPNYPATYEDAKVISVGASGIHGRINDNLLVESDEPTYNILSSYGSNMDVIAPGITDLVIAPIYSETTYENYWHNEITNPNYSTFRGTSAAAPHVAGVVALMLSSHNTIEGYPNNLAPEDVEFIIQKYATDVDQQGYDSLNGWGRLNATNSVKMVNAPYYVKHYNYNETFSSTDILHLDSVLVNVPATIGNIDSGSYYGNCYQRKDVFIDTLTPTAKLIDMWVRYSSSLYPNSHGVSDTTLITGKAWYKIDTITNGNILTTTVTSYYWKLFNAVNSSYDGYIPESYLYFPISLHIKDSLFNPNIFVENINKETNLLIYPNPANNIVNIKFSLLKNEKTKITIYNNIGQYIYTEEKGKLNNGIYVVNTSNYKKGIYYIKFVSKDDAITKKLIIN